MSASLLQKKSVVVVTGASQGYGKCLAEIFAKNISSDSVLILLARNKAKLESVAAGIKAACPGVVVAISQFDQSDYSCCGEQYFQRILNDNNIKLDEFQQAFILHNAGSIGDLSKFTWQFDDAESVDNYFKINVSGTILLNATVITCLQAAKVPSMAVVNVSSLAAVQAFPSWSLYCTGKAARDMFFQALAKENNKVRVLNWAPGPMKTDMFAECLKCADEGVRSFYIGLQEKGGAVECQESVNKLISLLDKNTFESGSHIDFYDV